MSERRRVTACPECWGAKLNGRKPCDECRGVGVVPEEREAWRLMGEECQTARKSINATLAEAAFYLGVKERRKVGKEFVDVPYSIGDVARMEAGLDDPMPLYRHWFRGM